jgi:PhnB protein
VPDNARFACIRTLEPPARRAGILGDVVRAVTPYLIIEGAAAAIDWYRDIFGAEEVSRMTGGAGRIAHAELRIGSSALLLGDEHVNYEAIHAPPRIGGSPVYLDIEADDVVELFDRAMAAGATAIRPPTDPSLPIQSAKIRDPFGHIWLITRTAPE